MCQPPARPATAWWEIIPEPQTTVSLPANPGQPSQGLHLADEHPGDWSIVTDSLTTGQSFSTTTPYTSDMDTEWIEEKRRKC
jgi:hypothetical protein